MTQWSRGVAVGLALGLAMMLCTEAQADRRRPRDTDSAEEADDDRESARERRRRRREEREAERRAAEAAAAAPAVAADAAPPGATEPAEAEAEEAEPGAPQVIYTHKAEGGRTLYTNLEMLGGEGAIDPAKLPPLGTLKFDTMPADQLRHLDGRLAQTVDGLQAGDRCEALRGASRVPFRTWLWREHQREVFVGVGLFVLALLAGFGWQSTTMRAILPIVPFAGLLYLGYDVSNRVGVLQDSVTTGLRACSTALEEGDASKPTVVRGHMEQVSRMSSIINGAYEQRDKLVEKLMLEYRM
jgi:hypothetical protein